ncbi:hypothetical protein EST38_g3748 [Candolleomyces aberdarensis]|uniref:Uncharacterized protein n=1 Tax=Candolleomyces aberdarensis TaxID=2316362 RepID=A0A4Q2DST8_9AGAR|nr:hypothetical protein EST38_g3748 [Candolleomyces aberdarensis]
MSQPFAAQSQELIPLAPLPAIDVENLNVGVIAFQNPTWHPKVTVYRLTVVVVTFGLGTAKALLDRPGSAVSVTIEWISGVVFLLLVFFLTDYESKESAKPYWFFKADVMNGARAVFQHVGIRIPEYDTEERPRESLRLELKHPPVTGYRVIVTAAAIFFGMAKAVFSYHGVETVPTAVEWIYGVAFTSLLYVFGLYEMSPNKDTDIAQWLFTTDYSSEITSGGKTLGISAAYLTSLTLVYWWTVFWFNVILNFPKRPASSFSSWLPRSPLG